MLAKAIVLEYTFSLKAVALDKVDLLTARIADLEQALVSLLSDRLKQERECQMANEANAALKSEVARQETRLNVLIKQQQESKTSVVFVRATLKQKASIHENLIWQEQVNKSNGAIMFGADGEVTFVKAGVYAVHAVVGHGNTNKGKTLALRVNGAAVMEYYDTVSYMNTVSLSHVLDATAGDRLSIVHVGLCYSIATMDQETPTSSIVIYALH